VAKAIRIHSTDTLDIEFGSLYPALKRLEIKGWIVSNWEMSETNRRAKYYRLTAAGKRQLRQEHAEWRTFATAIAQVMGSDPEGQT
jgi:transcriptional regulator